MSSDTQWVWVCVQHPMPLLVQDKGTPDVLERIPPWGDPDLPRYAVKFHDVLDSLESFPDFKLDFEISARELKDVLATDPSIIERMRTQIARGKLGFVGGDYSQSHCHVFGSESSLRQITQGLAAFQRILGYTVDVFFHQETGLHDQLPQLLKAFGYTVAVPPRFPYAMEFTEGVSPELTCHFGTLEHVNGAELTSWQGLDGTALPLYLSMPAPSQSDEIIEVFQKHGNSSIRRERSAGASPFERFVEYERQKNPVTVPRVLIECPDMKRITEDYYQRRGEMADFSLMGKALAAELTRGKPAGRARLYAYWSYIEGVWAESLSRANRRAESTVVQAEALMAMASAMAPEAAGGSRAAEIDAIWEDILSSQHHDVYWIETTELKRQALGWLAEATKKSTDLIDRATAAVASESDTSRARGSDILLLFNTLPRTRLFDERVALQLPRGKAFDVTVSTLEGGPVASQLIDQERWDDGSVKSAELMLAPQVPGLGYHALCAHRGSTGTAAQGRETGRLTFESEGMSVVVNGDGTLASLRHARTGREILRADGLLANEIRFQDGETGETFSSRRDGATGTHVRGSLADVFSTEGRMGRVGYAERIILYRRRNRLDFSLTLDFGDAGVSIGGFWDDATKMNVFWPFALEGEWAHDIPFGFLPARAHRPLYCTQWASLASRDVGVAYFNSGTTKHWIEGSTLANVIAWGGRWFSNRDPGLWELVRDKYDLRLYGRHTIEYALALFDGGADADARHLMAEERANPMVARWDAPHAGRLPGSHGLLEIGSPRLAVTSVRGSAVPGGVTCRMFDASGLGVPASRMGAVATPPRMTLRGLDGSAAADVEPFKIVELTCNP